MSIRRLVAIGAVSVLLTLTSCGGGSKPSPAPVSPAGVWDRMNWDQKNWQ